MSRQDSADANTRIACCIAGGGPAGMMLGLLLARAGVEVLVLEKHGDFLRDFRGDTIHPSTLEVLHELGLLDEFLKRPHTELRSLQGQVGDTRLTIADFSHLPTRCKFIALMPQWEFLDFLAQAARRYPNFHLEMQAEVTGLIDDHGHVAGVRVRDASGTREVRAQLVIGADGRHSLLREQAGLEVIDRGAPIDVLWLRVAKGTEDPPATLGRIVAGRVFVMLDRGDYWQCAYVIRKGGIDEIRARGLAALREDIAQLIPYARERLEELRDWDQIKLLTVMVDYLRQWYRPGLLCIGDAAHAMSPVGGIGINLAIQDAVAAANILAAPLLRGTVSESDLRAVQLRREWPTQMTQRLQVLVQDRVLSRVLGARGQVKPPLAVRLLGRFGLLQRIPARVVGMGFRPEHVKT